MNTENYTNTFTNELDSINNNLTQAYNSMTSSNSLFSPTEPSIMSKNILEQTSDVFSGVTETVARESSFLYSGWFILVLILVLSFLGINVMYILSKGSKLVGDAGSGIVGYMRGLVSWIILQLKNLLNITGEGTKVGVDIITDTGEASLELIDKAIDAPKHIVNDIIGKGGDEDTINSGLDIPIMKPHEDQELLGTTKETKQKGYCYIGTDNNVGSCMYVERPDMCMSKKIYPTMELCINKDNLERK
jgi:hypothetical protein